MSHWMSLWEPLSLVAVEMVALVGVLEVGSRQRRSSNGIYYPRVIFFFSILVAKRGSISDLSSVDIVSISLHQDLDQSLC